MESILSALYNGEIMPAELCAARNRQYRELQREHCRHYEDFIEDLNRQDPALSQKFIQIMDEQLERLPDEGERSFADGFRLGAKLMLEVFRAE